MAQSAFTFPHVALKEAAVQSFTARIPYSELAHLLPKGRPGRYSTSRGIILFHLSLLFPKGAARWSFTVRIEGAHSDRAASASKKDRLAAP